MSLNFLDFEQPIAELEAKIDSLTAVSRQDEKLDIKGDTVLNTAVALSTIFPKNDMIPDHIQFDSSYSISLIYGDITVQLGKDADLEEKMKVILGTKVAINQKDNQKGRIEIEYYSMDELDRIMDLFGSIRK